MEERLEDLEVRYAFLERQVAALDEVVRELAQTVVVLREELLQVRLQVGRLEGPEGGLVENKPPHY